MIVIMFVQNFLCFLNRTHSDVWGKMLKPLFVFDTHIVVYKLDIFMAIRLLSGDVRSAVSGSKPPLASLENTTSAAVYEHCLFILNL